MSECEPLSRPTWVLGVILRKEALFSYRNSCNCLDRIHQTLDFLNCLLSTLNKPPFEPPGFHGEHLLTDNIAAGLKNGIPPEVRQVSQPPPAEF